MDCSVRGHVCKLISTLSSRWCGSTSFSHFPRHMKSNVVNGVPLDLLRTKQNANVAVTDGARQNAQDVPVPFWFVDSTVADKSKGPKQLGPKQLLGSRTVAVCDTALLFGFGESLLLSGKERLGSEALKLPPSVCMELVLCTIPTRPRAAASAEVFDGRNHGRVIRCALHCPGPSVRLVFS